jgi:hypothetical protein
MCILLHCIAVWVITELVSYVNLKVKTARVSSFGRLKEVSFTYQLNTVYWKSCKKRIDIKQENTVCRWTSLVRHQVFGMWRPFLCKEFNLCCSAGFLTDFFSQGFHTLWDIRMRYPRLLDGSIHPPNYVFPFSWSSVNKRLQFYSFARSSPVSRS